MRSLLKSILAITICILTFTNAKGSPQAPDYLIIGKDTTPIYFLPLNYLDTLTRKTFFNNLRSDSSDFHQSFNLWRGYQAYWQLIDNQLYMVGLKNYPNSNELLKRSFPGYYQNGKVLAYWFSSYLAIAKGKMLKWDGIFSRTYYKEEVFNFKNGYLIERKNVDNYIPVKNGISRVDSNRKHITDTIFSLIQKLNWEKMSDCGCDDKYLVSINEKGKIGEINLLPYTQNKDTAQMEMDSHKECIIEFKRKLKNLQFDIVMWHGKPYDEKYYVEFFYDVDGKLENWTR